jgi:hypothetical protein
MPRSDTQSGIIVAATRLADSIGAGKEDQTDKCTIRIILEQNPAELRLRTPLRDCC